MHALNKLSENPILLLFAVQESNLLLFENLIPSSSEATH